MTAAAAQDADGPHAAMLGPGVPPLTVGAEASPAFSFYTDPGIYDAADITAGPDGALWFANTGSIGRITTAGVVTTYTDQWIVT